MASLKLSSFVLFVDDVTKSKDFYVNVMDREVSMDINNINVGFTGGLAIWERKYATNAIFARQAVKPGNREDFEIYFETGDIDGFYQNVILKKAKILHPIQTQPWQQRVFRLYDPDGYIIEAAETMTETVKRLYRENPSVDEVAKLTFMHRESVQAMIDTR
mgnify:CR=1 FL=1